MARQRVRRRPVRYPPIADETASVMMSQMMAAPPISPAVAPTFDHGETVDKPNPAPSASRISERAAAATAPPITAPQETPEEFTSVGRLTTGESILSMAGGCI